MKQFFISFCCFFVSVVLFSCKKNVATDNSIPPVPSTGMYVTQQFSAAQLITYFNVAYSTRPNFNGIQYTSIATYATETGRPRLTMQMDIAVPPNATAAKKQPLIIVIHGGGFSGGKKEDFWEEARSYARAGYVAATINYRLTPNNQSTPILRLMSITHAVEDGMNAIRYLKANAGLYNIDTSRIATVGSSAGGGISLVNAVEYNTLAGTVSDYNGFSSKVAGAISTGATINDTLLVPGNSLLHFESFDTPVLLFHTIDTDPVTGATWSGNVIATKNAINASGNSCTIVAQPVNTHVVNLSVGGPYWDDEKKFLWEKLKLYQLQ